MLIAYSYPEPKPVFYFLCVVRTFVLYVRVQIKMKTEMQRKPSLIDRVKQTIVCNNEAKMGMDGKFWLKKDAKKSLYSLHALLIFRFNRTGILTTTEKLWINFLSGTTPFSLQMGTINILGLLTGTM